VLLEALELARELDNGLFVASVLGNLALVALFESDCQRALSLASESLTLAEGFGDKPTILECLHVLAGTASLEGRLQPGCHGCRGGRRSMRQSARRRRRQSEPWVSDSSRVCAMRRTRSCVGRGQGHAAGPTAQIRPERRACESVSTREA
jgi:hypothetical protein